MSTQRNVDRRRFLTHSVGGAAGLVILGSRRSALGYAANERMNLAVIGNLYVAGHFFSSLHAYDDVQLVALCNPDERRSSEVFQTWEEQARKWSDSRQAEERRAAQRYQRLATEPPPVFTDFREMLEDMGQQIDAVVVSLFDHYHGVACGAAMRAGKHVFSERPLGLTIGDARALRELAGQTRVATSIRNPGNAINQFRRGLELVREGVIGPVEEVHVWFDRGGPDHRQPPQGSPPVPERLHWDLWLGPAAMRPYHPDWMAYAHWRDFSNGGIGTFGPHAANLAFMSLDLQDLWQRERETGKGAMIRVRAECSRINRLSFPEWETIRWQVPARGQLPPVAFTWYHGPGLPPGVREQLQQMMADRGASDAEQETLLGYAGAMLVGRKGVLATDDHNVKFTLLPREPFEGIEQDSPQSVAASHSHYRDWLIACRGGEPAWANFGYAGLLSEFLMLGNVATQFEEELEYDPIAGKIINHPPAEAALRYEYRPGWKI